ncbi:hypothetical protein [Vibrio crassostreae]|uniref:hypothetical protein n=1 Tax=Vibrio crassostreae TaxID=246167 RepID=UPI001B30F96E|nr:hypothetical protein [Vibrio crassostreae]
MSSREGKEQEVQAKYKKSYEALGSIYWQVVQGLNSGNPQDAKLALEKIQKSCLGVEPLLKNVNANLVSTK